MGSLPSNRMNTEKRRFENMSTLKKIIGNQEYRLKEKGEHDNLTKAIAKKTAESIRKKEGLCRIIKKSNGRYQIWVNTPYTLADIKWKSRNAGQYFFSKKTMKYFRGDKFSTRYEPSTGITYLRVIHPKRDGFRVDNAYYKFSAKTGELRNTYLIDTPFFFTDR